MNIQTTHFVYFLSLCACACVWVGVYVLEMKRERESGKKRWSETGEKKEEKKEDDGMYTLVNRIHWTVLVLKYNNKYNSHGQKDSQQL